MPPDREAPAPASPLWSCWKIFAWLLGLLAIFLTALLAYDTKLEPYDDLTPTPTRVPDLRTNGYLMLKASWENWLDADEKTLRQWRSVRDGEVPWDDTIADALNPHRHNLSNELQQALAAPEWVAPLRGTNEWWQGEKRFYYGPMLEVLEAAARQNLRTGNPAPALSLVQNLRALSRREIKGSHSTTDLMAAYNVNVRTARLTCSVLADSTLTETSLLQLASAWEDDQLTQVELDASVAGDSLFMTNYFLSTGYEEHGYGSPATRPLRKITTKPNASLNFLHRVLRLQKTKGLATAPTGESSVFAELEQLTFQREGILRFLDANFSGRQIVWTFFWVFQSEFLGGSRYFLFETRAVRIAIAIKRWQLRHPGQIPAQLEDLVREYLAFIPADPWDGSPLRWSATDQIIYAVGTNWTPDVPVFPSSYRAWIGDWDSDPGLRLVIPPPPHPPTPAK
ncbi:MAG: hypothetical protein V4675_15335 [Verrucomicrobiota bacterium]